MTTAAPDLVGAGVAFPLRLDPAGGFALSRGEADVVEAIRIVLGTAPGDRPMRPDFGCALHEMVFDPLDASFAGRAAAAVTEALEQWEPRIDVLGVEVDADPDDAARVFVSVRWSLRGEDDPRNLVFPFYVIPGES